MWQFILLAAAQLTFLQDDDGHDWYCFECHGPGEMYACSDCWRVFHADCQDEDTSDIKYTCAICKVSVLFHL